MPDKKTKNKVPATWLYVIGRAILSPFYRLIYRLKAEGLENVPKDGPLLLCCNHLAKKDPILLGILLKRQIFFMGKEELFQNKFLGALLRSLGVFPVARGTGGADALQRAYDLLDGQAVVGIFLEGTRSKTGQLGRPKTGAALLAAQSGAPVLPACITGDDGTFPRPFHRTIVKFAPPMALEIPEASSTHLRRASRSIMGEIGRLRAESRQELGLPPLLPEESESAK